MIFRYQFFFHFIENSVKQRDSDDEDEDSEDDDHSGYFGSDVDCPTKKTVSSSAQCNLTEFVPHPPPPVADKKVKVSDGTQTIAPCKPCPKEKKKWYPPPWRPNGYGKPQPEAEPSDVVTFKHVAINVLVPAASSPLKPAVCKKTNTTSTIETTVVKNNKNFYVTKVCTAPTGGVRQLSAAVTRTTANRQVLTRPASTGNVSKI